MFYEVKVGVGARKQLVKAIVIEGNFDRLGLDGVERSLHIALLNERFAYLLNGKIANKSAIHGNFIHSMFPWAMVTKKNKLQLL